MSTSDAARGGYIRFPRAWMALPISPAAKCLLVHFCGAADADGASWYSYAQLATLLGRSRASVTSYVAELREAGLIETERQRTATGFNYRLRIRIVGWRGIVARWARCGRARAAGAPPIASAQKTERRVRAAERKNPSGSETENPQTDSTPPITTAASSPLPVFGEDREAAWRRCHDHPSDSHFRRPPSEDLLRAVIDHARRLETHFDAMDATGAIAEASDALAAFAARKRLHATPADIAALASVLARRTPTRPALARALTDLSAAWPAHWRKLSAPAQLERWLADWLARQPDLRADLSLLWRFRNRALRAEAELRRRHGPSAGFPAGHPALRVAEAA